jgi:uncharacterized protein YukE
MGIGATLIGGLASGFGARSQRKAAKSAAAAQEQAAQAANETEWKMYQQGRKDLEPWRKQGAQSLSQLAGMMRPGTDMTTRFSSQDFRADPGYQYRLSEAQKGMDRSQAARGMLNSGAALKEAMKFGQGLASDEYQNAYNRWAQQNSDIYNRLAGLANTGQQTSNQLAQLSGNYASQYGQNIGQAANARASAYAAKAGANQNMLSDLMGLGSMYYYGKK